MKYTITTANDAGQREVRTHEGDYFTLKSFIYNIIKNEKPMILNVFDGCKIVVNYYGIIN